MRIYDEAAPKRNLMQYMFNSYIRQKPKIGVNGRNFVDFIFTC